MMGIQLQSATGLFGELWIQVSHCMGKKARSGYLSLTPIGGEVGYKVCDGVLAGDGL